MPFVAGAVLWGAYTLGWWGWLALTDRVPPGTPDSFWWPSILDLVRPGSIGKAVPPRLLKATAGTLPGFPVDSSGNATSNSGQAVPGTSSTSKLYVTPQGTGEPENYTAQPPKFG